MEQQFDAFCSEFLKLFKEKIPMVVVTMTDHRGGAPQDPGSRMIVGSDGLLFGTVGGGKIENKCLETAREMLNSTERQLPKSFTWNLQKDIGMSCGGEVTMFFEMHQPALAWNVAIFGAGHVSQELTRLLMKLDCHLTVIDSREEWIAKLPAPTTRMKYIWKEDMSSVIEELPDNTFVALMTMGHSSDLPILKRAFEKKKFPFVGVIGSKAKRNRLEAELGRKDFHCPLGLDFGSNAPIEIAISMIAQLLQERDKLIGVG
ncbi:MAG: XdhC family protein [Bacteriovoracaceae bacterium]|nr:XdhC family protein [Bacteriovoracaceae bacterium]